MDFFWLAKTSNKTITLKTWLAVNPLTNLTRRLGNGGRGIFVLAIQGLLPLMVREEHIH